MELGERAGRECVGHLDVADGGATQRLVRWSHAVQHHTVQNNHVVAFYEISIVPLMRRPAHNAELRCFDPQMPAAFFLSFLSILSLLLSQRFERPLVSRDVARVG